MTPNRRLDNINIVIGDADSHMRQMLAQILHFMGFHNIRQARDAKEVLHALQHQEVDLLITDWQKQIDGVALTQQLRHSNNPLWRALPIVMLTARGEMKDVETARDAGISEFAGKPYTSKALFDHLQQVVEHPRNFVVTPAYRGPDRRRRSGTFTGQERRVLTPKVVTPSILDSKDESVKQILSTSALTILPDFSLKKKMGITTNGLNAVIPASVITECQKTINALQSESLGLVMQDMIELERAYGDLCTSKDPADAEHFTSLVLSIKSRTFGNDMAAQVALLFYSFLRNSYVIGNAHHNMVVLQYVQTLRAVLTSRMMNSAGAVEQALLQDLQKLNEKYAHKP